MSPPILHQWSFAFPGATFELPHGRTLLTSTTSIPYLFSVQAFKQFTLIDYNLQSKYLSKALVELNGPVKKLNWEQAGLAKPRWANWLLSGLRVKDSG